MTAVFAFLIGLTFLGILSPLLTFAALFQQKEWRLDRLREHMRRDGWFTQLFGMLRPAIVLCAMVAVWTVHTASMLLFWMFLLAGMSAAQIILRKQRYPARTSKALALCATALIIDAVLIVEAVRAPVLYPLIVMAQPAAILLSWLIWRPVDLVLKKRVMDRAMRLRSRIKDATVIGIAGSVGKTTVKELIAHLLQDLHPIVTPAHVNTEMGVAQWLTVKTSGHQPLVSGIFVIEMGAYRKREIALLCRIAQPTIGVMTALGSDHLALFGSEEAIVDANGELIEALPKDGHAFLYGDNASCRELAKRSHCPVTLTSDDDALAKDALPLEGRHNIHNVLLAAAVARHLKIPETRIKELLRSFKPQPHTFSVKTERGVTILDDTYNISPLSFDAALEWAADRRERPRVLLTSGLQETGAGERRFLAELGAKAAANVDRVIFTDAHGADAFSQAFGKPVEVLHKQTERVAPGSVLLAVGRMPLSTINRLLPRVEDARS